MTMDAESLQRAVNAVREADGLIITAGAGMGVDSGLPDFRGAEGFWNAYPALRESGIDFYQAASPAHFERDPASAWGFYGHRLNLYRATVPHEGFGILKRWGERMPLGMFVYTSNVDGQFQQAGFDAGLVAECHGAISMLQCMRCAAKPWTADGWFPVVDEKRCRLVGDLPTCPACGALVRPNILMFEDWHWKRDLYRRRFAELQHWLLGVRNPVIVEIGAGTAVSTIRNFGDQAAGALVRINVRDPEVIWRMKDVSIQAPALQALRAIDALLEAA